MVTKIPHPLCQNISHITLIFGLQHLWIADFEVIRATACRCGFDHFTKKHTNIVQGQTDFLTSFFVKTSIQWTVEKRKGCSVGCFKFPRNLNPFYSSFYSVSIASCPNSRKNVNAGSSEIGLQFIKELS